MRIFYNHGEKIFKTQKLQVIKEESYKLDCIKILNVYLSKDVTKNKKKIYISEGIVCNTMWCVYLSDR